MDTRVRRILEAVAEIPLGAEGDCEDPYCPFRCTSDVWVSDADVRHAEDCPITLARSVIAFAAPPDYVTVKFSKQLVGRMGDWGAPVQCKLEPLPDGTAEMWCRYPGGEVIPDEVVRAACEQLYPGCTGEKFMAGTRTALEAALLAWRS